MRAEKGQKWKKPLKISKQILDFQCPSKIECHTLNLRKSLSKSLVPSHRKRFFRTIQECALSLIFLSQLGTLWKASYEKAIVSRWIHRMLSPPPSPVAAAKAGRNNHGQIKNQLPSHYDRREIEPNHT